ncbi:putative cyclin-D7-1 [Vitis vinifera]|nr:putative cyclin-D7-1 [Vitis vinifera]RVW87439.1 putative cyclin-D7-1 [Vitis vinifera]|eukprot:XP_002271184.3 PREDICTED: putative cyclin-D7-1 [Vitis vinifera]
MCSPNSVLELIMESLLCDEIWLTSPVTPDPPCRAPMQPNFDIYASSFYTTKQDREQALAICMRQELSYMPEPEYAHRLRFDDMGISRFRVIQWIIKSRSRLNLSLETVFSAANYLDRFISMNQWHGWKYWMVELLSVACLSVASKFTESFTPSFDEIQMEDLEHSFESSTIQRMELTLLQALGWRLRSTTPYTFAELLLWSIDSLQPYLHQELITRVTDLLLHSLSDSKFLDFRPSVVAVSAIRCCSEELLSSKSDASVMTYLTDFIPPEQKDDLARCQKIMELRMTDPLYKIKVCGNSKYCPSSPITVLTMKGTNTCDCHVNLSVSKMQSGSNINFRSNLRKRMREGH